MRKLLCLTLCLLLCGCAPRQAAQPVASLTEATGISAQAQASMTLRCGIPAYAPDVRQVQAAYSMADGFLLVSEDAITALDSRFFPLGRFEASQPVLLPMAEGVACYLPQSRELVLLDGRLAEKNRVTLPPETQGSPLVSADGRQVYYTTDRALRVWDLDSGIRRRVKELDGPGFSLTALLMEDSVLACQGAENLLLLDAQNGQLLHTLPTDTQITTRGRQYFAALPQSTRTDYLFGQGDQPARMLLPRSLADECTFLPAQTAAVALHPDGETVTLEYYDLNTGALVDSLTLPQVHTPKSILPMGESQVLLLVCDPETDCDMLLTWTVSRNAPSTVLYTSPYYTRQNPDADALSGCQNYARQIASKYGIQILVGQEAAAVQPWDYTLESEYLERVLMENLKLLDQLLSHYPKEVLTQTAQHFGGLNLCLVRQIRGSAASGSLDIATGIQYLHDGQAYVALALGPYMEQALYHELFHTMEICIFARSKTFDTWETLNPAGFSYDYDYAANAQRNAGIYLEAGHRAFVDQYSMSYPKEDRARIMEYAMLSGQKEMFQTPVMQNKLKSICQGIRDAYGLKKDERSFLWEQYLA